MVKPSKYICKNFNPLRAGNPLTVTITNSEDPDEMLHKAAINQGLPVC